MKNFTQFLVLHVDGPFLIVAKINPPELRQDATRGPPCVACSTCRESDILLPAYRESLLGPCQVTVLIVTNRDGGSGHPCIMTEVESTREQARWLAGGLDGRRNMCPELQQSG